MTRVQCPGCGRVIRLADAELSLVIECARCNTRFPAAPARVQGSYPLLAPCNACGRSIATEANSCPKCGAPDHWTHPAIVRFLSQWDRFQGIPRLQAEGRGFILQGRSIRPRTLTDDVADAVGSLGFFGPLTASGLAKTIVLSVGARHVSRHLRQLAGREGEAFIIDFHTEPPAWRSTHDAHWADVMEFFGLPAPAVDCPPDAPEPPDDLARSPAVFLLILGGLFLLAGLGFCLLFAFALLAR